MNESVREFLEDKNFVFDHQGIAYDAYILDNNNNYVSFISINATTVYKDCLDHYLKTELGRHWQLFGGTIPIAQYLDASVVADIQQALSYWQELNNENR